MPLAPFVAIIKNQTEDKFDIFTFQILKKASCRIFHMRDSLACLVEALISLSKSSHRDLIFAASSFPLTPMAWKAGFLKNCDWQEKAFGTLDLLGETF